MRSRKSNPFMVQSILLGVSQEREEQFSAQVAALSCEVSLHAIHRGINNYIINNRKKPKTKYEFNQERVRDFRVGKSRPGETVVPASIDEVAEDLEQNGKASYFLLQTDPPPFVRNYKYDVFQDTLKMLNPHHPHFHSIAKLDLSNQMIGEERFMTLTEVIAKSSISILNLSGNKLSNRSMRDLSDVLRSMHHLSELNISRNKISDEGIGHLFEKNSYSATIQKFDCSYNMCNATAAFYMGAMFSEDRPSQLDTFILGGKVGNKGWGDEFLKVFISCVITSGIKTLKHLSIADAGISEVSLNCLSAVLVCDGVLLESLNISKNEFGNAMSKVNFTNALRLNQSLRLLTFRQSGFSEMELSHVTSIVLGHDRDGAMNEAYAAYSAQHRQYLSGHYKLTWQERASLAYCVGAATSMCMHAHHKVKISFIKDNPWRVPGPPAWQIVRHAAYGSSDLLSNIAVLFQDTQVVLPEGVKGSLAEINRDMKYADLLVEALQLSRTLSVDPRSVQLKCARKENERIIMDTIQQIERELSVNEARLAAYTSMRKVAVEALFKELEQFRTDSEAVLRVAKRRERSHINVIIANVSKRMNTDRLLQCAEDGCGAVMAEVQALEQLIGALYRQKLLHGCLLQESTISSEVVFDFAAFVGTTMPYYGHLTSAATFVHYFYIVFGVERKENAKIKEKVLQNLQRELNNSVGEGSSITLPQLSNAVTESPIAKRKSKHRQQPTQVKRKNVFMQLNKQETQAGESIIAQEETL